MFRRAAVIEHFQESSCFSNEDCAAIPGHRSGFCFTRSSILCLLSFHSALSFFARHLCQVFSQFFPLGFVRYNCKKRRLDLHKPNFPKYTLNTANGQCQQRSCWMFYQVGGTEAPAVIMSVQSVTSTGGFNPDQDTYSYRSGYAYPSNPNKGNYAKSKVQFRVFK